MKRISGVIFSVFALLLGLAVALPAQADSGETATVWGQVVGPQLSGYSYEVNLMSYADGTEYGAPLDSNGNYSVDVPKGAQYDISVNAVSSKGWHSFGYRATVKNQWPETRVEYIGDVDDVHLKTQYFVALKGTVSSKTKNVWVTAWAPKSGSSTKNAWHLGAAADTDKNGKYVMPLVVASSSGGKYFVEADMDYKMKWSPAKSSVKTVKPTNTSATTFNVTQKKTGTITGKITLPSKTTQMDREVLVWKGKEIVGGTTAKKSGKFTIKGLPAGNYKVSFAKTSLWGGWGEKYTVPARIYKGKKETVGLSKGKTVKVKSGKTTKNINDKLVRSEGGTVTGSVKKANKKKQYLVRLVPKNKNVSVRSAVTNSKGAFKIQGLSPGTYTIELYDWDTGKVKKKGTVKVTANKTTKKGSIKF